VKSKKFVIVDYGVGNMRSLLRAFEYFGADIVVSEDPKTISAADAMIMPGDGAFKTGMDGLAVRKLTQVVLDFAKAGKPTLGICLGAQILFSWGFEFGKHKGLDLIGGRVVKFPKLDKEKIPQIGWNSLELPARKTWKNTILSGIKPGSDVYFIHSYIMMPEKQSDILAYTYWGGVKFCSVVFRGYTLGTQFHPEKSGVVGLQVINNFIKITKNA